MRIAIIPNLTRKHAYEVTKNVCDFLSENGVEYFFENNLEGQIDFDCRFMSSDELLGTCDIVIAVGGDGSIIHAAKKACKYNKPILGVNAGNLAFMAGLEKNEISLIKNLISGNYVTDNRMLLEVSVFDKDGNSIVREDFCVNDIAIARGEPIKMVKLNVACDGNRINEYYADGIIISTPTGSTAYSLSAGGPVVDPRIESILLTPICTHSLFARSIVFDSNSEICVTVPESEKEVICISCDGDDSIVIPARSKLIIKKSKVYADFIRIKNDSFIDILNSKLSQRRV